MSKRTPSALSSSTVSSVDGPPQKAEALREAYKRHNSELVTIDEQQAKVLLVMLGILSAGATLLASGKGDLTWQPRVVQVGLSVVVIALLIVWVRFTFERHSYRQAVRDLLVRCEMALGFYENNAYLQGDKLYTDEELGFPTKGGFMLKTNVFIVVVAALGFMLVLWSPEISSCLHLATRRTSGVDTTPITGRYE